LVGSSGQYSYYKGEQRSTRWQAKAGHDAYKYDFNVWRNKGDGDDVANTLDYFTCKSNFQSVIQGQVGGCRGPTAQVIGIVAQVRLFPL
jgi:hypothetical protein